jgi:hypothetical protein
VFLLSPMKCKINKVVVVLIYSNYLALNVESTGVSRNYDLSHLRRKISEVPCPNCGKVFSSQTDCDVHHLENHTRLPLPVYNRDHVHCAYPVIAHLCLTILQEVNEINVQCIFCFVCLYLEFISTNTIYCTTNY